MPAGVRIQQMLRKRERSRRGDIFMVMVHAPPGITPQPPENIQSRGLLLAKLRELHMQIDPEHHGIVNSARCYDALKLWQSFRGLFPPRTHCCVSERGKLSR